LPELGKIMKINWQTKKLGELYQIGSSKRVLKSQWKTSGVPFYRGREITRLAADGFVDNELYISEEHFAQLSEQTGVPQAGDIVLTAIGTIGNSYVVRDSDRFYFKDASVLWLKQGIEVRSEFVNMWLKSPLFFDQLDRGNGATVDTLTIQKLQSLELHIPPLAEQRRIVKILDDILSKISKAKENTEKNLQNSKELFGSYLQSVFANPGTDWEEKKLNEISENMDNKRIPITKKFRTSGEYPYYGASGVVDYVGEYIFDNDLLLVSEDGANLLARTYPIAFSISGKSWVNNHAHILRFEKIHTQKFVEYYLNSIKLNPYVSGMAQPKLNQKMLNAIPIPYPPLLNQKAIVTKLDALSAETKKLEAIYTQKLADLEELKKSVLKKAFAGEL